MLAENGTTTIKVLWKCTFKEHEVLYNSLFNMTLLSHSLALLFHSQLRLFHFPIVVSHFHCADHVTLNLILENSISDSREMARTHTNAQVVHPVTFVSMHFHGHRATCDCIVIADQTAPES